MSNNSDEQRSVGLAWFRQQCEKPSWVINVAGYGAFVFEGTEQEAEEMRAHKARWEGAVGHKRPASFTDFPRASTCWNHPGYLRLVRYGSRRQLLKRPYVPSYYCECGGCSRDQ